jgi:ABC-2 type transport system ATP-binding protein
MEEISLDEFDLTSPAQPAPIVAPTVASIGAPIVPESAPNSIEAVGLYKQFKNLLAVDNLSLNVREGEFFGFLGPNGAGKSTTIRMLCGLLRPDAGQIRVAGYDLTTQPLLVKAQIGVLPEETNLYERLTSLEALLFAGQMFGLTREEARERADDLLALMELTEAKDKLIVDYSMGMKKKTALATALIHRPKVMFLDEPFNGIDPISVRAIRNVLRQLTERGTTIFISSHVMEVIERLCSRVAIINKGRIVGIGTLSELRAASRSASDSSLEDIFLKLVEARVSDETLSWL